MNKIFLKKSFNEKTLKIPLFFQKPLVSNSEMKKYKLDGLSQSYRLSENYLVETGSIVRLKTHGITNISGVAELIFGRNDPDNFRTRLYIDGIDGARNPYLRTKGSISNGKLDGVHSDFDNGYPLDGETHNIEFKTEQTFYISYLGSHDNGRTYFVDGSIFDLEIIKNGVTELFLPLTNKSQGAIQQSSIGNVTATIINYTDNWQEN